MSQEPGSGHTEKSQAMNEYERESFARDAKRRIERDYLDGDLGDKVYLWFIVDELLHQGYSVVSAVPAEVFAGLIRDNCIKAEITVAEFEAINRDCVEESLSPQVDAAFNLVDAMLLNEQSERQMDALHASTSAEKVIAALSADAIRDARASMSRYLKEIKADPSLVLKAAISG